jgi:hypothetical protein
MTPYFSNKWVAQNLPIVILLHTFPNTADYKKTSYMYVPTYQGDQIGRIFAQLVIVLLGQFYKNYRSSPKFWATFFLSMYKLCSNFDKKNGWATFWATFSQTPLVTLLPFWCKSLLRGKYYLSQGSHFSCCWLHTYIHTLLPPKMFA